MKFTKPSIIRNSLSYQFFIALVVAGILPLIFGGTWLLINDQNTITNQSSRELTGLARGIASTLDLYITDRIHDVNLVAGLPQIQSMDADQQEQALERIYFTLTDFSHLYVYDRNGDFAASSHAADYPSLEGHDSFETTIELGNYNWEIETSLTGRGRVISINVPIRDVNREVVGVVIGEIEVENITTVVNQASLGSGGNAFVLDQNGFAISHPAREVMNNYEGFRWPIPDSLPPTGPGTFRYEWNGESYVASYSPVPKYGWTVVVEQPERIVVEPVIRARVIGIIILFVSSLLALLSAAFLSSRLSTPLRQLALAARAFGAGDSNIPLPQEKSAEEINTTISAFSEMRHKVSNALAAERKEHELNQTILATVPTGLMILSSGRKILSTNHALNEILGLEAENLDFSDLFDESNISEWVENLTKGESTNPDIILNSQKYSKLLRLYVKQLVLRSDEEAIEPGLLISVEDLTEITEIKSRYEALQVLQDVNQIILESSDIHQVMESALMALSHYGGFEAGAVRLISSNEVFTDLCATLGNSKAVATGSQWHPEIIEMQSSIVISKPSEIGLPLDFDPNGLSSVLLLPIRSSESVVGVIQLGSRPEHLMTEVELNLYNTVGNQLGLAVEKIRLDEALRQQEAEARMLALVASRTDNAVILADSHGRIEWVNDGFTRITGFTLEEVLGKTPGSVLQGPASNPETVTYMRSQLRQGLGFHVEMINYHKDGNPYWIDIEVQPILDKDGNVSQFMGLESDITQRKNAEEEIERQRDFALLVLNSMGQGLTITNDRGKFEYVNPAYASMLGYFPEELIGRDPIEVTIPEDREKMRSAYTERVKGDVSTYESRLRCKDGGEVQALLTGVPRSKSGHYEGSITVVTDLTERKQIEKELQERSESLILANIELERSSRMKDEFLASMSHELRTPLTGILGLSESLREAVYGELNPEQLETINYIDENGHHLLNLINDILDLSKIEAGKMILYPELISVDDVQRSIVKSIEAQLQKKQIGYSYECKPENIKMLVDSKRIKQILLNLFSNAIKFTPEGGAVGLSVIGNEEDETITFTVWDTGIGIAASDIARLFQPFVQVDARLSRQYGGTGLGLSLIRRLVELHGGSVTLESVPEKGSRFSIALPWDWTEKPYDSPIEPGSIHLEDLTMFRAKQQGKIVLIDDNPTNTKHLAELISQCHWDVFPAYNGPELMELVQHIKPDILLMNVHASEIPGLEMIRRIRSNPDQQVRDIRVVMLSSLILPGDRDIWLQGGANAYLSKPLRVKTLLDQCFSLMSSQVE